MDLSQITGPEDLKQLNSEELNALCAQIRNRIIDTVSDNGGHLASNLGTVELTVALLRAFHMPEDQIVFDVGHQCYTYKMLTGREADFGTLRQYGGISGFPNREESGADLFTTGHASNAISVALGMARSRSRLKEKYDVVAVRPQDGLSVRPEPAARRRGRRLRARERL